MLCETVRPFGDHVLFMCVCISNHVRHIGVQQTWWEGWLGSGAASRTTWPTLRVSVWFSRLLKLSGEGGWDGRGDLDILERCGYYWRGNRQPLKGRVTWSELSLRNIHPATLKT